MGRNNNGVLWEVTIVWPETLRSYFSFMVWPLCYQLKYGICYDNVIGKLWTLHTHSYINHGLT